jgi:hypothetical protein
MKTSCPNSSRHSLEESDMLSALGWDVALVKQLVVELALGWALGWVTESEMA